MKDVAAGGEAFESRVICMERGCVAVSEENRARDSAYYLR